MQEVITQVFREASEHLKPVGGLSGLLSGTGLAERKAFGTIIDLDGIAAAAHHEPFFHVLYSATALSDPHDVRKGQNETLRIVRQLKELGHPVVIEDLGDPKEKPFIQAAVKAGATKRAVSAQEKRQHQIEREQFENAGVHGTTWARDRHIRIDGHLEAPQASLSQMMQGQIHTFGEGGAMVQVGPKEWLVEGHIISDPRTSTYASKGHLFHAMPGGLFFDRNLSHLFGEKIYTRVPHIDFSLGGIPEKKVVAICPHYRAQHRLTVDLMESKLGVRIVEVPKGEADRHPANFLPLGNGVVMVDSGAPEFIERLRKAGVHVVPTAVSLDSILVNRGGLHCLFNELN